jgi:hypothetical protein
MHRLAIAGLIVLVACDPVRVSRLRIAPVPVVRPDSQRTLDRAGALALLDRVVRARGLIREVQRGCVPYYTSRANRRGPGTRSTFITVCVTEASDTALTLQVSEGITFQWSPQADTLRRVLADSLSSFGLLKVDHEPIPRAEPTTVRPPNGELSLTALGIRRGHARFTRRPHNYGAPQVNSNRVRRTRENSDANREARVVP